MKSQRGGFALGMVVGLLIGVAVSLAVALYVTKVPVPFINKVPQRTAEQDAAETERNRNWDPNAPLSNKPVVPPTASTAPTLPGVATPAPVTSPPITARPAASAPPLARAIPPAPATPATPMTPAVSARPGADPFLYFVQAGAYGRTEEAEQQRAKLAMLGYTAKVTEREQSGRTVYRVRLGPFDKKDLAEGAQQQLAGSGVEAALVRVQK